MNESSSNMLNEQEHAMSQFPKELLEKVFENVSQGIMVTDKQKRILSINLAFEFVTGYKIEDVKGKKPSILQSGIHNREFYLEMSDILEKDGVWQGEIWNRRKTGELYPEWLTIVEVKDQSGNVTNYCGIFTDLSERKIVENELEKRALYDSLTEISNRFAYIERMKVLLEITKKTESPIKHAVLFLNLDRFKQVNDTLGHEIGDQLLIEVSKRVNSLLKNKDILARFGGDEFVITLANIQHPREAAQFAERVIKAFELPIQVYDQEIYASTSIGISVYPDDGNTTDRLIICAARAMTYSKEIGRNCFSFYFEGLKLDSNRVLLLDSELRKAIENREFTLVYQPKIHTISKEIIGIEALVRWNNEKLGHVSPAEFIDYAEESGLIIPLSEIIFDLACEGHHRLVAAGYSKLPISINVSSLHFQQQGFLESIQTILERNNASAQNFEIELTERTVMNSAQETVSKLVKLKQLGFKLSIDDFGTGYSSLSYLVRFPLDILKIDRSFIQHICSLDDKQAIVDAIIQMAHRLQMKVVAEGVETSQQAELLETMGCDYIQGYYYSKPLPIEELIDFIHYWEVEHQGRI